jgi:hypothetical protein
MKLVDVRVERSVMGLIDVYFDFHIDRDQSGPCKAVGHTACLNLEFGASDNDVALAIADFHRNLIEAEEQALASARVGDTVLSQ